MDHQEMETPLAIIEDNGVEHNTAEENNAPHHDSMVTVRLSEPPIDAPVIAGESTEEGEALEQEKSSEQEDSAEEEGLNEEMEDTEPDKESPRRPLSRTSHLSIVTTQEVVAEPNYEREIREAGNYDYRRGSVASIASVGEQVNWEELEKTEEQEPRDQDSEDSTALLLARLEQENNLLVTNPKSGLTIVKEHDGRSRSGSRPPSMHQLKKLVNGPTPSSLRYSLIPPPPMTDLEFYGALVQDYKRTAQRLPTLLSKKIRTGIPPPLRGVVWQSMSGARDEQLEDEFDRLCGESSPYEGIISKDLGRSFPGVEMFRDPEGDGQRMLGRVLKCFSLYDQKIGYCQGLGFIVGPLLMHMGDKQAFCIIVRLMENYDLRSCFLPDLSGLHVRIYQFRELLRKHLPALNGHLEHLQIEPAYVSQWFLSFFAVTCPLPMLFRIYDVIFAEGASETIMRVALAVMRKNEEKITACTEVEDVMQLLLSRGLWDCYHYNPDELVDDFVSLTSIVTHDSLRALETKYKESKSDSTSTSSDVGSAASRFLGRLWAGSNSSQKSATLSPGGASSTRPPSFLRRSPSKQSIASTLNSIEGGTDSVVSSSFTEPTNVSRDSSNTDISSVRAQSVLSASMVQRKTSPNGQSGLHGQIEDLLMALSELQRDHTAIATQLQREREEREEDHMAVRSLLDGLRRKRSSETFKTITSEASVDTIRDTAEDEASETETVTGDVVRPTSHTLDDFEASQRKQEELSRLLEVVEDRVTRTSSLQSRRSSMLTTKAQLREELARSKEQLVIETSKTTEVTRRLKAFEREKEEEANSLKEQLRESHVHIRSAHSEKQRLEKQIHDLRNKVMKTQSVPCASEVPLQEATSEWPKPKRASTASHNAGLRELRLGRSMASPSFAKRSSSLHQSSANFNKEGESPFMSSNEASPGSTSGANTPGGVGHGVDSDALILELVQAKTSEAVAKQEAEEAKAKLESLRRLLSGKLDIATGSGGVENTGLGHGHKASPSSASISSGFMSKMRGESPVKPAVSTSPSGTSINSGLGSGTSPTPGGNAGAVPAGFWGGWGKRSFSIGQVPAV